MIEEAAIYFKYKFKSINLAGEFTVTIIQFPENFVWGVSTSAYQIEGSLDKDGRGPSIWDVMAATPGKIYQGDDASIACDSYNRYEEDIQLMKELGVKAYRFSVSWPRIYPNGFGEVNRQGIEHYKRMVTKLLENGIEPFCTLYHWERRRRCRRRAAGRTGKRSMPSSCSPKQCSASSTASSSIG